MSALTTHVDGYVALRRALGFKASSEGRVLDGFVRSMDSTGQVTVTVNAALAWAAEASTVAATASRLTVVRGFARYLAGFDPATEIPPTWLVRANKTRPAPHIYSPAEITALMAAADTLAPDMWAATMSTAVGLMTATGLRPAELYRLGDDDVALGEATLSVVHSKRGKSRRIPLHTTTVDALRRYRDLRDRAFARPVSTRFFAAAAGNSLTSELVAPTFRGLVEQASIPTTCGHRPRLGDLRHTFAVRTMIGWHQAGEDVARRLPVLSAYLGHNDPGATYWYLEAVPELMAIAARRIEESWQSRP